MAIPSDEATSICSHCDRSILSINIDLHYAHCSRYLERCKHCGDMVPKKHAEEHYLNTHAPVFCSLCSEKMEREILAVHRGQNCPQRILACEFCECPLAAIDLPEHQEVCGNRTEWCHLCRRYIRLRERNGHESSCNGVSDTSVGASNNTVSSYRRDDARAKPARRDDARAETARRDDARAEPTRRDDAGGAERDDAGAAERDDAGGAERDDAGGAERDDAKAAERERSSRRRPPTEVPHRRVLFTIAVTGIAVLLGSLFFPRKKTKNSEIN